MPKISSANTQTAQCNSDSTSNNAMQYNRLQCILHSRLTTLTFFCCLTWDALQKISLRLVRLFISIVHHIRANTTAWCHGAVAVCCKTWKFDYVIYSISYGLLPSDMLNRSVPFHSIPCHSVLFAYRLCHSQSIALSRHTVPQSSFDSFIQRTIFMFQNIARLLLF